ncbi:type II toxin-antitoxin system RelE/ParE family toxin [Mesorhizobium sp. NPDC059054]|uniref:type II toxin-antitoxin system RelE/ParE family toxin n=1 Tax=Mesorhizobium sp. NPDC059054 TaxID=3346711 RepID=UPI003691D923
MIKSFKDRKTEAVAVGNAPKGFPSDLIRAAQRKLFMIEQAVELKDLASPPGNKLHPLKDNREGQHAIRINDQFRICFRWVDGHAEDVEITDYH